MSLRRVAIGLVAVVATYASPSLADEASRLAAEELFLQGRKLVEAGDLGAACPKLAESQRLDPAPGTLLNLAECYEATGKLASAWVRYKELYVYASQRGQTSRAERATAKIAELEPRLFYLTITVRAPAKDLVVTKDGVALGRAAWGTRLPVDPGDHVVAASAPGRRPWTTTLRVEGASQVVEVPLLAPLPRVAEARAATSSPAVRTAGTVLVAIGAAATVSSLGFGLGAKLEDDKARADECSASACTPAGAERIDRAIQYGNVATGLALGAAVFVVAGVVLYVVGAPRAPAMALRF